jgi:hypothetical protein
VPPGWTPEGYLSAMATDMNKAVGNGVFNSVNVFQKATVGQPQIGSVYFINIPGIREPGTIMNNLPGDSGSVIIVDMTPSSFTFQTITTNYQGTHPENGARQFGFVRQNDGSVVSIPQGFHKHTIRCSIV